MSVSGECERTYLCGRPRPAVNDGPTQKKPAGPRRGDPAQEPRPHRDLAPSARFTGLLWCRPVVHGGPEQIMTLDPLAPLLLVTAELPGIGGRIKVRDEDFEVEEIPAYQPSGQGDFLYLWLEKRG